MLGIIMMYWNMFVHTVLLYFLFDSLMAACSIAVSSSHMHEEPEKKTQARRDGM